MKNSYPFFYNIALLLLIAVTSQAQWLPNPNQPTPFPVKYDRGHIYSSPQGGVWTFGTSTSRDSITIQYIDNEGKLRWPAPGVSILSKDEFVSRAAPDKEGGIYIYTYTGGYVYDIRPSVIHLSKEGKIQSSVSREYGADYLYPGDNKDVYAIDYYTVSRLKQGKTLWTQPFPRPLDFDYTTRYQLPDKHQLDALPINGGFAYLRATADSLLLVMFDSLGTKTVLANPVTGNWKPMNMLVTGNWLSTFIQVDEPDPRLRGVFFQQVGLDGRTRFPGNGLKLSDELLAYQEPVCALETETGFYVGFYTNDLKTGGYVQYIPKVGFPSRPSLQIPTLRMHLAPNAFNIYADPNNKGVYITYEHNTTRSYGGQASVQYLLPTGPAFGVTGIQMSQVGSAEFLVSRHETTGQLTAFFGDREPEAPVSDSVFYGRRITCLGCNALISKATPLATTLCAGSPLSVSLTTVGLPDNMPYRAELLGASSTITMGTQAGSNPQFTVPTTTPNGNYKLKISSTDTFSVTTLSTEEIHVLAQPVVSVSSNSPVLQGETLSFSATGGESYQWTGPNALSATGNLLSLSAVQPIQAGLYTLTAVSPDGCRATSQLTIVVTPLLSTELAPLISPRVYPSPTSSALTVQLPTGFLGQQIQLLTAQGNLAGTYELTTDQLTIDVSSLSAGIYLIQLPGQPTVKAVRFLKL
ncbi:T9SS type A sorting domain-containing protein [Fibrella aquatica]|uniref:T9SS type A sorting domain-containing protein n=1 Tax=Fibrella aquatica TaxID=3242487 RepID=UPI0035224D98